MAENTMTPFQQALVTAVLEEYRDIPPEEEIELSFSPAFEESMRHLVEPRRWAPVRTAGKTVRRVILVAILLAALATTALAVPSVREAIVKFFVTESKDRYHIQFDPESTVSVPRSLETVYCPTYIPEHYTHTHITTEADRICHRYSGEAPNQYIYFYQYLIPEDLSYDRPRSYGDEVEILYVNGLEIHNFHYRHFREDFVWTNGEYLYMLAFHVPEEAKLFQKIFASIQPVDSQ